MVQAFGQEKTEIYNYKKYLKRARDTGVKTHMKSSMTLGGFMLVIFGYYAYGFYTGSFLLTKQIYNDNLGRTY